MSEKQKQNISLSHKTPNIRLCYLNSNNKFSLPLLRSKVNWDLQVIKTQTA